MKKVLFRAPVLTQSGYGVHARQLASWLLTRNDIDLSIQALPWGNTPWIVDQSDNLIHQIMTKTCDPSQQAFDVTFQLQLPNEWDSKLGKYNVGITAAVETDRCNPEWAKFCNKMDSIIVPSTHAKNNLNHDVQKTIKIIPEAYSLSCLKSIDELPFILDEKLSTDFNFLVFGQITGDNPYNDRKNTFFTLKWLFEEFKNEKNVGIILKTNAGRNTKIDRNKITSMMQQIVSETRHGPFPRLHIIHGELSDDEVVSLYKDSRVKALVSATRGEGFGLPLLEAAASKLPVIATNWSGHLDFLNHGKFINLYYNLKEIHQSRIDNRIFLKGMRWAEPSETDFKQRLRKFYKSPSIPQEWAIELSKKIINEYSPNQIMKKYDDILNEALTNVV